MTAPPIEPPELAWQNAYMPSKTGQSSPTLKRVICFWYSLTLSGLMARRKVRYSWGQGPGWVRLRDGVRDWVRDWGQG